MSKRTTVVTLIGAAAIGAIAGWPTGLLWLFLFVVARIGAQRFSGRVAKLWPIISAVSLAEVVLLLRAAF